MKRIMVVPDVHGRTFWKEPVMKYLDEVDRIVFLGDYLDPYPNEENKSHEALFQNMMEIIELKQSNEDKVVLLKGNHDQHYSSKRFRDLAGGTRMDEQNWDTYHKMFNEYKKMFKIAHMETINGVPYVFSHAGMTLYWLFKVNINVWQFPDNQVLVSDPNIIDSVNLLDDEQQGQDMLAIIGNCRSLFGEQTGSVLWADIEEHHIPDAPKAYGLNQVFQVFGHTMLNGSYDKLEYKNLALIDSQQCFIIDENIDRKIMTIREYENIERK